MAIRKYLFWMTKQGIKTYKVESEGQLELMRFKGEEQYFSKDIVTFIKWFEKSASIASADLIDFCYLSEEPLTDKLFAHKTQETSSWTKSQIIHFINNEIAMENYKVIVDPENSFICQTGNLNRVEDIKTIYLQCMPKFTISEDENKITDNGETSILNKYFMDLLKEIN